MGNKIDYTTWIGKKVNKGAFKKSGIQPKPFKSGFLVNTVKGVHPHPHIDVPAFSFEEDNSLVACRTCKLIDTE